MQVKIRKKNHFMKYKDILVQFLLVFSLLQAPAAIMAHNIDTEIITPVAETAEFYSITNHNWITVNTCVIPENVTSFEQPGTEEEKEPILVVTGNDNGTVDEWSMWFKGNGTSVYRLCTHRDEPIWGATPPYGQVSMSSKELFRIRGSILNLKVWEQLQFYVASLSASVVGSDENSAETYTIGDGLFETVYKSPGGGNTTSDKPPRSSSELPSSAFANAVLTRTATGARLEIDGIPSARCGEESLNINSTSPIIKINISNAELSNWTKLEKTIAAKGPGSDGNGKYAYEVTVTATLPNVGVEIIGCTEIGAGEESVVTAKAAKEGGTYRFWAEPRELFSIETKGSLATLHGSSPGRGTLYVEYTGPDGKKTEAKKEALCVQVETYNDGQIIPQIPLFDIDGKKLDGILNVPVEINPNDAADLLSYLPANPGVLTAVGLGDVVTMQGILPGKTTLQAKTKCGANTGPEVEVEVVNCDDETIARLEKMKKAAIENLVATTKDLQRHAGSKEFEKARDELTSSAIELLAKIGLTIISGGKTSGVVTKVINKENVISKAIPDAADIADYGSAFSEIIGSSSVEDFGGNVAKPASGEAFERIVKVKFGDATKELYGKSLGAIIGLVEVGMATDKFYDNVGQLVHHEDVLEKFKKMMEKAEKDLEYIQSRQNICKRQKDESEIPKTDLPPLPDKPGPPKKPVDSTAQEPQSNERQAEQQTTDEEVLVDPEPPAIPPRQVGLPYEPDDCGCDSSKNLTVTAKDLSTLGTGLKNLGECAKNFKSISVTDYQNALTELSELTGSLSAVLETDAAAFLVKAKESKPQLDALVKRVKAYDEAGKAFLDKMEKCPESISTGMDILKSVEQITVDSIKTKY